jgi:hypothetical protein
MVQDVILNNPEEIFDDFRLSGGDCLHCVGSYIGTERQGQGVKL